MKILLTGASGFVGGFVRSRLEEAGHHLIATSRSARAGMVVGPVLGSNADWRPFLKAVDVVVHAAALAHASNRRMTRSEYIKANCEGTLRLAAQAAQCGVKRFVFLSTIGVLGDYTLRGRPFDARSVPSPMTDYAYSKWQAEEGLERLWRETGMQRAIIRSPLVYGVGAPGNVGRLWRAIQRGHPIPLGAVTFNRRSFVSRANLADLIVSCMASPQAAGGKFLVSDDQVVSTAEFIVALARAARREVHLVQVPVGVLSLLLWMKGGARLRHQLLGDLEVDSSYTKKFLGWTPRYDIESALHHELSINALA